MTGMDDRPGGWDMRGMRPAGGKRPKSNVEALVTGLVIGGGFMAFWAFGGHQPWALVAAFFAGALPAARGLSGIIAQRAEAPAARRLGAKEKAAETERAILRIARDRGGRITPAIVALDCDIGVEEAEAALDGLAKKGHASLRVRDDGRVEYEFSEFLAEIEGR
jgi:hypothetical protein